MTQQVTRPGEGNQVSELIKELVRRSEHSGSVKIWPVTTVPAGWLKTDGSAISRVAYRALFALLGTTYGVGDGSTTFNLPSWTAPTGGYYIIKA